MNSNDKNKEIRRLGEEIASTILKRKKNYKCKIHDKVRDFLIKNLYIIDEGLEFIEKELRVVGGDVDIVAKKGKIFYLIEVKTRLSRNYADTTDQIAQLLIQMKGLNHIISMFTNEEVTISLMVAEYVRDKGELIVKNISKSGKINEVRSIGVEG